VTNRKHDRVRKAGLVNKSANPLLKGGARDYSGRMTTTCDMGVSLADLHLAMEALLPADHERLLSGLAGEMHGSALCPIKIWATWKSACCAAAMSCFARCWKKARNSRPIQRRRFARSVKTS